MSKKNLIFIIIAIILIILGIIYLNKNKDGNNNTPGVDQTVVAQDPILDKKTNGTYEIYNTNISTKKGTTEIEATIKNVSGETTPEQFIDIVLLDKNNNELGTIKTTIPSLGNGESTIVAAESFIVYSNIYNFKIK